MNIAIDVREVKAGKAGKGRYVEELVKSLAKIDTSNQYFLLSGPDGIALTLPDNFRVIKVGRLPYLRIFWQLRILKVNVFLSTTSFIMSLFSGVKTITVVHDLAVFVEPRSKPSLKTKIIEKLTLFWAVKKSRAIIAVSNSTKRDLIRVFGVNEKKINVIPLASFSKINNISSDTKVIAKYHLPKRYILYVGTLEPRKNVDGLIIAYGRLSKALRDATPLILVGKRGWNTQIIDQAIKASGSKATIRELGFVPNEDLPSIYKQATLFVYPSWYEGFGFPVLEAMSYGVAVITSDVSSLPEVAARAARLIQPDKTDSISEAITQLLSKPSEMEQLKKAGLKRASLFSWERTAQQTLNIISQVGNNG